MTPDFRLQYTVWTTVILISLIYRVYMTGLTQITWVLIMKVLRPLFSASSDMSVCSNAYISPEINQIAQHEHTKDLLQKICYKRSMLTLFKSIVLSA